MDERPPSGGTRFSSSRPGLRSRATPADRRGGTGHCPMLTLHTSAPNVCSAHIGWVASQWSNQYGAGGVRIRGAPPDQPAARKPHHVEDSFVMSGADHWTLANGSKHPTGFWVE